MDQRLWAQILTGVSLIGGAAAAIEYWDLKPAIGMMLIALGVALVSAAFGISMPSLPSGPVKPAQQKPAEPPETPASGPKN